MTGKQNAPEIRFEGFTDPWEQRKLGSIAASFDYGLNAAATEYDGQNKYLRITDIDDATHEFLKSDLTTPLADLAMSADYLLEEGDLLFARTGASVGKTYLYRQYDGTVYFAGFLIRARIGESADPEFVYQATLTDAYKKYVAITSQRSGQPGVNAQEYADYQLMLPSRTEQQQIGMALRSLDNLITLHQRKYDKLCTVKKSMLDKMFPKPGETEPEIRFEGFTDPWEQRKLEEVALVTMGQSPNGACYTNNPNDAVLVQGNADLKDGWISPRVWTTEITKTAKAGDLIMSVRAPVGAMGKTAYDVVLGRGVAGIAGNEFLFQALSKKEAEGYWSTVSAGSTFDSINGDELRNTLVDCPCSELECETIGDCLSKVDSLITLHQRKLELLRNIKKSLLDRMFV